MNTGIIRALEKEEKILEKRIERLKYKIYHPFSIEIIETLKKKSDAVNSDKSWKEKEKEISSLQTKKEKLKKQCDDQCKNSIKYIEQRVKLESELAGIKSRLYYEKREYENN